LMTRVPGQPARRGRTAGALAVGVIAAGLAAVTGCGVAVTNAAGAGAAGAGGAGRAGHVVPERRVLCADPAAVSRVQITAIPTVAQLDHPVNGPRRIIRITVSDPAKARTLARAVCGLPRIPPGSLHCPIAVGGSYQLTFSAAGRRLPVVGIQTSGCEMVRGAGPVRWAARTAGFWTVLERAAGVRAIAHAP
jgi:hypothetical protein